jgi:hypothetical protein
VKETEEDTRRSKRPLMFMDGYTTKSNLQIQCNPYQNFSVIFTEIVKSVLKFYGSTEYPIIAQAVLSKKNSGWSYHIPFFKVYYRATVTKTTWSGTEVDT